MFISYFKCNICMCCSLLLSFVQQYLLPVKLKSYTRSAAVHLLQMALQQVIL